MTLISEMASALWGVWTEMFSQALKLAPKVISFFLWFLSAIIILPCVFIAGEIYPKWVKWGEDM